MLPKFIAIAAYDPKGVIGLNNALPWHYPEDLRFFQQLTLHQVMLMGHKTYTSMAASSFKDRSSLIFSRKADLHAQDLWTLHDISALEPFYEEHPHLSDKRQCVIGGAEIFELFFAQQLIHKAMITHIHKEYLGDTYFPLSYLSSFSSKVLNTNRDFTIVGYEKKM